jgi:hypothetical protein
MAQDILWVEHKICPEMPMIRFTNSIMSLRGQRRTPVLTIDPKFEFREQDRVEIGILSGYGNTRGWNEQDFKHLQELTVALMGGPREEGLMPDPTSKGSTSGAFIGQPAGK